MLAYPVFCSPDTDCDMMTLIYELDLGILKTHTKNEVSWSRLSEARAQTSQTNTHMQTDRHTHTDRQTHTYRHGVATECSATSASVEVNIVSPHFS